MVNHTGLNGLSPELNTIARAPSEYKAYLDIGQTHSAWRVSRSIVITRLESKEVLQQRLSVTWSVVLTLAITSKVQILSDT